MKRLNIPGFHSGESTGESIDVAKLFGGRPTPKRSGNPHGITELVTAKVVTRARKGLQLATRIAKEDYQRRKRTRNRETKKAIPVTPVTACNRRFFEHLGMNARFLAYVGEPELFISRSKRAYEITDGFLPMVSVTSSREAMSIVVSLAKHGIAAYFNVIAVPTS